MRIGVVTSAYHPEVGGVETHARRLCAGLVEAGDEVEVLTQHTRCEQERIDGVLVRRFPLTVGRPDFRFSAPLWRWLARHAEEYDVLHAHSYHALAALPAAVTNRTPLVFTPHYHGTGHSRLRAALHPIYRPVGRRIVARAGRLVCVTRAERDLLLRDFPEAGGRIVVIPNGTDPGFAAAGPGVGIVCAGRLERYKRVDRVIRAMTRLPGHRLDVVGAGPARAAWERLARALGLGEDRVRFHGRLDDEAFAARMAAAAAAVSASEHEAFGMAVADALAAGLPTVASDLPAHRELAEMAGAAAGIWLVDPEDEDALASALEAAAGGDRPAPSTTLPTWSDVVRSTREVYASVTPSLAGSR